eukprot:g6443.t1
MAVQDVPELRFEALFLRHRATGALHVHIDTPDTNNTFSVAFRTAADHSRGVAHVLEHTVLCGSERYPARDPFFQMTRRSLNSYMNALTADDHTMYPFTTSNAADFGNLLSVYLDAAFFPLLREEDFLQEGHRLEYDGGEAVEEAVLEAAAGHTAADQAVADQAVAGQLRRAGVVLNEMKGALSDSSSLFGVELKRALHAGTCYEHCSGGLPEEIPALTYDELCAFHREHYHPSNALFVTYGDLPLVSHLDTIDGQALSRFAESDGGGGGGDGRRTAASPPGASRQVGRVPVTRSQGGSSGGGGGDGGGDDPGWLGRVVRVRGPPDAMGDPARQVKWCWSVLCNPQRDAYESFKLLVASHLLLSGPSAPLYRALCDSHLAPSFTVGTGYDASSAEHTFGVGVEGIAEADVPLVAQTVRQTLEAVLLPSSLSSPATPGADGSSSSSCSSSSSSGGGGGGGGFDPQRIDAALHRMELGLKQVSPSFGLNVVGALSQAFAHEANQPPHTADTAAAAQQEEEEEEEEEDTTHHRRGASGAALYARELAVLQEVLRVDSKVQRLRDELQQGGTGVLEAAAARYLLPDITAAAGSSSSCSGSSSRAVGDFEDDTTSPATPAPAAAAAAAAAVTLVMAPDAAWPEEQSAAEAADLQAAEARLTAADRAAIVGQSRMLRAVQQQEGGAGEGGGEGGGEALPCLDLADIPRSVARDEIQSAVLRVSGDGSSGGSSGDGGAMHVQVVPQPTNGITYLRLWFPTDHLWSDGAPLANQSLLPLLSSTWASLGAGRRDHRAFSLASERVCGGFGFSWQTLTDPDDAGSVRHGLLVSTSCLDRNLEATVRLLGDLLLSPGFDRAATAAALRVDGMAGTAEDQMTGEDGDESLHHFHSLVASYINSISSSMADASSSLARSVAAAPLNRAAQVSEVMGGMTHVRVVQAIQDLMPEPPGGGGGGGGGGGEEEGEEGEE